MYSPYSKNKSEILVHLVCFIIRIHHDARSSECQRQRIVAFRLQQPLRERATMLRFIMHIACLVYTAITRDNQQKKKIRYFFNSPTPKQVEQERLKTH